MTRADFNHLTDDEIRSALYVAAAKLAEELRPRLKADAPELKDSQLLAFEDACLERLAAKHGVAELFVEQEA